MPAPASEQVDVQALLERLRDEVRWGGNGSPLTLRARALPQEDAAEDDALVRRAARAAAAELQRRCAQADRCAVRGARPRRGRPRRAHAAAPGARGAARAARAAPADGALDRR